MKTKKILLVFGTRPEAIKMAPLVAILKKNEKFLLKTVATAQHRKMLDQVLDLYQIIPDYDLDIMTRTQTLNSIAAKIINNMDVILKSEKPDLVLVHGDTTTACATALAAYYSKVPVAHIEAGLRSGDLENPYPEEQNRRLIDSLSSYHFAPTNGNKQNLVREYYPEKNIYVTGNTGIDALKNTVSMNIVPSSRKLKDLQGSDYVLITAHRRENFGKPLLEICRALKILSKRYKNYKFVYPVHLNPNVHKIVYKELGGNDSFILIPPVSYEDMVYLLKHCRFCFTDSGGLQEEAPSLAKPVLVLRDVTERPEAVQAGTVKIIGTSSSSIIEWGTRLFEDKKLFKQIAKSINPYGDGKASARINSAIEYIFGIKNRRPEAWKN